jgi:hypothetical protein
VASSSVYKILGRVRVVANTHILSNIVTQFYNEYGLPWQPQISSIAVTPHLKYKQPL